MDGDGVHVCRQVSVVVAVVESSEGRFPETHPARDEVGPAHKVAERPVEGELSGRIIAEAEVTYPAAHGGLVEGQLPAIEEALLDLVRPTTISVNLSAGHRDGAQREVRGAAR